MEVHREGKVWRQEYRRGQPTTDLQAVAASNPERLDVVCEPSEVPLRISRCHFAVTAGNNWSLELACVGVPQLIVVQAEVHWPTAQRLEEEGAATCLGWHGTVSSATVRQCGNRKNGCPNVDSITSTSAAHGSARGTVRHSRSLKSPV